MKIFILKLKRLKYFIQGLIIGTSELVPGVSGANFAMVMGVYDDYIVFLDRVTNFIGSIFKYSIRKLSFGDLKESTGQVKWLFGIPLLLGMFIASVIFSNLMTAILSNYQNFVYAFFFGLVAGSVFVPWSEMKTRKPYHFFIMVIAGVASFIIFGLKPNSYGINPPESLLFVAGVVGTVGAILPGVSGTFLLILFGLYDFVINLLASITTLQFDIEQLKTFSLYFAGQIIGLVTFIKLVKFLLDRFPDALMALLVGVIGASLRIVFPWFEKNSEGVRVPISPLNFKIDQLLVMLLLIIAGFALVVLAGKLGADRQQIKKISEDKAN
ncbi:MAG: DUF368 domain-containing protein [Candidatus Dojkabacteria bacterium]